MMSDLTPGQIAAWFRQQAAQFNQIADTVEATFKSGVAAPSTMTVKSTKINPPFNAHPIPTADALRSAIRLRGMRSGDAAAHFGVTPDIIHTVVTSPGSGLKMGERGWIKEVESNA